MSLIPICFVFLSSLISVTSFQLNYCNFFCADLHADLNCINTLVLTASIYLFSLGNATSVYILEHCNVMVHIKMKDCMRKIIFLLGHNSFRMEIMMWVIPELSKGRSKGRSFVHHPVPGERRVKTVWIDNHTGKEVSGLWRQNRKLCKIVGVLIWAAPAESVGRVWQRTINEGWVELYSG